MTMDLLQTVSILSWGLFFTIFLYEVALSKKDLTDVGILKRQDRLKFGAAPVGTLLMVAFGLRLWIGEGVSISLVLGLILLVVGIVISSTLVPKYFKRNARRQLDIWLIVRNASILISCVLFFI